MTLTKIRFDNHALIQETGFLSSMKVGWERFG